MNSRPHFRFRLSQLVNCSIAHMLHQNFDEIEILVAPTTMNQTPKHTRRGSSPYDTPDNDRETPVSRTFPTVFDSSKSSSPRGNASHRGKSPCPTSPLAPPVGEKPPTIPRKRLFKEETPVSRKALVGGDTPTYPFLRPGGLPLQPLALTCPHLSHGFATNRKRLKKKNPDSGESGFD